jgi:ABC-type multidrug transport system fused ATPase/permease subunit
MKQGFGSALGFLKSFFLNYFWLGVVIILTSIVLEQSFPGRGFILTVLIHVIEAVGIAIVVASIFSFASGTSKFMGMIRGLLEEIVVSREFLGNISEERKREVLGFFLKATSKEKEVYKNIDDYYNVYINETLGVSKKCVRSNYNVVTKVYFDTEQNKVAADQRIVYRLYPTADGNYSNVKILFSEEEVLPRMKSLSISNPKGQRVIHSDFSFEELEESGKKFKVANVELDRLYKNYDHLDIELCHVLYGYDKWIMLNHVIQEPTDGFKYFVTCENSIQIFSYEIFIFGARAYADMNGRKSEIEISCGQWVNEGNGVSVLAHME